MKSRTAEASGRRARTGRRLLPASMVVFFCLVFAICRPGSSLAVDGADNCLSCHIASELLPVGISFNEETSNPFGGQACPGLARINRVAALTESSLTELNVLINQDGLRGSAVDKSLIETEARYRLLREEPVTYQSHFAEETGKLRRQMDSLVLKPMATDVKKRRLMIFVLCGVAFAVVITLVCWRVLVRRSRHKPDETQLKQPKWQNPSK